MDPGRRPPPALVATAILVLALELVAGVVATRARAIVVEDQPRPIVLATRTTLAVEVVGPDRGVGLVPGTGQDRARFLLVRIERAMPITARPGAGRVVGTIPAGSRFYGEPTVAWVRRETPDARFGLLDVPYASEHRAGWIRLRGLERSWTRISVVADLSEHRITVRRGDGVLFRAPAATGAPVTPTPTGRYFVTDRVAFPAGGVLGTFAFGLSGIQPNLPAGWSAGDQLAIHGTDAPSSIGRSASAGCLRVSESVLGRLRPLLRLGTPVIVRP
jgi:lipoprotein-anchoring transpeptidase ErfK/SrfK